MFFDFVPETLCDLGTESSHFYVPKATLRAGDTVISIAFTDVPSLSFSCVIKLAMTTGMGSHSTEGAWGKDTIPDPTWLGRLPGRGDTKTGTWMSKGAYCIHGPPEDTQQRTRA